MLTVLDIGISNIGSITNALTYLGKEYKVAINEKQIELASKIIFPGVGSFAAARGKLNNSGLVPPLTHKVLEDKVPILGICLGMQLLTEKGFENGETPGLGYIKGTVEKIKPDNQKLAVPHMGWNDVTVNDSLLYSGMEQHECFYFVHSYECQLNDNQMNIAYTNYGDDIVASFSKGNIHGVQFHPEKSQLAGLRLLRNFVELC